MAVADEVAKRSDVKSSTTAGATSDGTLQRERLRMMMLIRRFEERTYQEYTKPGQRIGGLGSADGNLRPCLRADSNRPARGDGQCGADRPNLGLSGPLSSLSGTILARSRGISGERRQRSSG